MRVARLSAALLLAALTAACGEPPSVAPAPSSLPPPAASSVALPGSTSAPATPPGPPVAPVRDVADTYFGTKVIDPYRWMETDSPELSTWMKAEADHTRRVLDALPLHAELASRVKALDNAGSLLASALPIQGAVRTLSADPAADGALFPLTSPARGRAPEAS